MKTPEDLTTFAGRMKAAREALGITQTEFAKRAEVSVASVGMWEAGDRKTARQAVKLAQVLRVTPTWLTEGRGPRYAADQLSDLAGDLAAYFDAHVPESIRATVHTALIDHIDSIVAAARIATGAPAASPTPLPQPG